MLLCYFSPNICLVRDFYASNKLVITELQVQICGFTVVDYKKMWDHMHEKKIKPWNFIVITLIGRV